MNHLACNYSNHFCNSYPPSQNHLALELSSARSSMIAKISCARRRTASAAQRPLLKTNWALKTLGKETTRCSKWNFCKNTNPHFCPFLVCNFLILCPVTWKIWFLLPGVGWCCNRSTMFNKHLLHLSCLSHRTWLLLPQSLETSRGCVTGSSWYPAVLSPF